MILTLLWLFLILVFSTIPVKGLQTWHLSDTVIHFVLYGITAVLFMKDFRSKTSMKKSAVLSIIFASLFGFVTELIQSAIPWRECSFSDMMANVSGAVFFTLLYILVDYYRKKI